METLDETLARAVLTDAELEQSINRLLDDDSVAETEISADANTAATDTTCTLAPDAEPNQSQARESNRLSVGNVSEEYTNRSEADESNAETEDKASIATVSTIRYKIPKPRI